MIKENLYIACKQHYDDISVTNETNDSSEPNRGQLFCADQSTIFNFQEYRGILKNPDLGIAPTCDRCFQAYVHKGDYHDNFDSIMFLKWQVAVELTYPIWCQEMQRRQVLVNLTLRQTQMVFIHGRLTHFGIN